MDLTFNEEELIKRGYDLSTVKELSSFSLEDAKEISNKISLYLSRGCIPSDDKTAIYIGGIPGSGKTTALRKIKENWLGNNVICIIGLDNYRIMHPRYKDMEEVINKHWLNKEETENESKGNDIAYFTNDFAGVLSDLIIDNLTDKGFNVAIEWGMRNPIVPLETMEKLKKKGYKNIVRFIVIDKYTSKEACKVRDDILNKHEIILRRIPEYFHEEATSTIPYSAEQIYNEGYLYKKIIDEFELVDRDNNVLWDNNSKEKISDTYLYYINNKTKEYMNNPYYSELSYQDETNRY